MISFLAWTGSPPWSRRPAIPTSPTSSRRATTLQEGDFKNYLDGYNQLPYLTGKEDKSRRKEVWYFSDDLDLLAVRYGNYKLHFMVQDSPGTLDVWQRDFRNLRFPLMINLRLDPYERAPITSNTYWDWTLDHVFLIYPLQDVLGQFMGTFKEYPPVQIPGSFTVEGVKKSAVPT